MRSSRGRAHRLIGCLALMAVLVSILPVGCHRGSGVDSVLHETGATDLNGTAVFQVPHIRTPVAVEAHDTEGCAVSGLDVQLASSSGEYIVVVRDPESRYYPALTWGEYPQSLRAHEEAFRLELGLSANALPVFLIPLVCLALDATASAITAYETANDYEYLADHPPELLTRGHEDGVAYDEFCYTAEQYKAEMGRRFGTGGLILSVATTGLKGITPVGPITSWGGIAAGRVMDSEIDEAFDRPRRVRFYEDLSLSSIGDYCDESPQAGVLQEPDWESLLLPGVMAYVTNAASRGQIQISGMMSVRGLPPDVDFSLQPVTGRRIAADDESSVMIDAEAAAELDVGVGSRVTIDSEVFDIVGITPSGEVGADLLIGALAYATLSDSSEGASASVADETTALEPMQTDGVEVLHARQFLGDRDTFYGPISASPEGLLVYGGASEGGGGIIWRIDSDTGQTQRAIARVALPSIWMHPALCGFKSMAYDSRSGTTIIDAVRLGLVTESHEAYSLLFLQRGEGGCWNSDVIYYDALSMADDCFFTAMACFGDHLFLLRESGPVEHEVLAVGLSRILAVPSDRHKTRNLDLRMLATQEFSFAADGMFPIGLAVDSSGIYALVRSSSHEGMVVEYHGPPSLRQRAVRLPDGYRFAQDVHDIMAIDGDYLFVLVEDTATAEERWLFALSKENDDAIAPPMYSQDPCAGFAVSIATDKSHYEVGDAMVLRVEITEPAHVQIVDRVPGQPSTVLLDRELPAGVHVLPDPDRRILSWLAVTGPGEGEVLELIAVNERGCEARDTAQFDAIAVPCASFEVEVAPTQETVEVGGIISIDWFIGRDAEISVTLVAPDGSRSRGFVWEDEYESGSWESRIIGRADLPAGVWRIELTVVSHDGCTTTAAASFEVQKR